MSNLKVTFSSDIKYTPEQLDEFLEWVFSGSKISDDNPFFIEWFEGTEVTVK